MLSDSDIRKMLDKEIVIYPFNEEDLTPIGYNLNPSDFFFSLNSKSLIKEEDSFYEIQPHDTVLILTKEAVWVSKKISGTFHSKVGVVSEGFGHISTTLDPGWVGPLLISINNPTDNILKLSANKSFVTLVFYKMKTPAQKDHDNKPSRKDILKKISDKVLDEEITENSKMFLRKVQDIFENENVYVEFDKKYTQLSQQSKHPIILALKKHEKINIVNRIKYGALMILEYVLLAIILLRTILYFNSYLSSVSHFQEFIKLIDKPTFMMLVAILIAIIPTIKGVKEEIK